MIWFYLTLRGTTIVNILDQFQYFSFPLGIGLYIIKKETADTEGTVDTP
jgi:hypothetical protein